MHSKLHPQLLEVIPELKIGLIHYTKISVGDSPQMLKGRLQLFQEQLFFEIEEKGLHHFPNLESWRMLFKKTGTSPSRYRPSAEALYRRVAKQNYFTPVHSAVDSNTFFSLYYSIPLGLYDSDRIGNDILFDIGTESTKYAALNGRETTLHGILHSSDEAGPFGSPYVDSLRSAVTRETINALHIVYLSPTTADNEATKLMQATAAMFTQIHGGDAQFVVLSKDNPEGTI
ncbi:B3/4 domain-containing protein [Chryseomicrobium palamuruense]|uniref:B3/4 domain-containing protein n=1 Tax=Chryseomicrobium palamuruense TaxID=682973 RepID=A0ABV8URZ8_9BACL